MRGNFLSFGVLVVLCSVTVLQMSGCDGDRPLTADEYVQRATNFTEQGNFSAAVIELKNALQADPEHLGARWQLAHVYLDVGNGAAAEKELIRAKQLGIEQQSLVIPLGEALLLKGEHQRVLDEIKPRAVSNPQERAQVLRLRGDAMLMLGMMTDGCELYERSMELTPEHIPTYRGLAQCALAAKDSDKARALIDEALDLDDTDPNSWIALGYLKWFDGDLQAAVDAYSNALKNDPRHIDALFHRAQVHLLLEQTSEAKSDVDMLRKLNPRFYGTDYVDAMLLYSTGNRDQALSSIQRALLSRPDYAPAKLLSAILSYDTGNFEMAAAILQAYLRKAPTHEGARKLLAATYLRLNKPDQVMEVIRPNIKEGKADLASLRLAGEAQLRSEGAVAAMPFFEQVAKQVPDNPALLTRVAMNRLAAGSVEQGIAELETASSLSPEAYRADIALAYQHLKDKHFDKALQTLEILQRKLPDSPGTYNLKGLAYLGKGDAARARDNFEKALALRPTLVSAAVRLVQLDLADYDIKAAKSRYTSILEHDSDNIPAMVGLAELEGRDDNKQAYLDWLTKAAAVSPAALSPRILLARYYASKADMSEALLVAREAVDGRPESGDAWALLGDIQMQAERFEDARLSFNKLAIISPQVASTYYRLGSAEVALGNGDSARDALRKAIELDPDYSEALRVLHDLEVRSGNSVEADRIAVKLTAPSDSVSVAIVGATGSAEQYKQAVAKATNSLVAVKQHQQQLANSEVRRADEMLLAWIDEHPKDKIARSYLAKSYLRRERESEAIEQYEALLESAPNNQSALNNLAVLYHRKGDGRALPLARKVYELAPDSAAHADTLGWILFRQSASAEGLKLLEQAASAAPSNPAIRLHLAEALLDTKQVSRARKEIDEIDRETLDPMLERHRQQLLDRLQGMETAVR